METRNGDKCNRFCVSDKISNQIFPLPRLAAPCRVSPGRARTRPAMSGLALPLLLFPCYGNFPCPAMPCRARPCLAIFQLRELPPAMPRPAPPCRAMPCSTKPLLLFPCYGNFPCPARPSPASPCRASPCQAAPGHARPHPWFQFHCYGNSPASPRQAAPCPATPCLAHDSSDISLPLP